jgi:hypothetical protein
MPDSLALNVKGQVRVADVTVGTVILSVAAVLPIPAKGRRHFGLSRVLARGEEYLWETLTRGRIRDAKTKFNTQHDRELLWDLSMQSLTAVGDEVIERQGLSRCGRRRRGGLIIEGMDRVVQDPFDPLVRACSGACDAPDELVGQCLLKLGILGVAAIFPAGEVSDHCSPEDGIGGVAGVAERELVGGGALVEELSKWRGELRVLGGHQGS